MQPLQTDTQAPLQIRGRHGKHSREVHDCIGDVLPGDGLHQLYQIVCGGADVHIENLVWAAAAEGKLSDVMWERALGIPSLLSPTCHCPHRQPHHGNSQGSLPYISAGKYCYSCS